MDTIRAYAPATVANVCCGFDILGFAMDSPGDEVVLRRTRNDEVFVSAIHGDGGLLPLDPTKNTASVAVRAFQEATGLRFGVSIELYKNLPLGSGMGSSAASAAAAVVAINALAGSPLSRHELVPFAMEAERVACGSAHADNVAPSILGGFVLIRDYQPLDVIKLPIDLELYCTLVHPHLEVKTSDSRKILRPVIALKDSITQSGNVAGLITGLFTKDLSLVSRSLKDVIAEPVRSVFIPGYDRIRQMAMECGALGAGISGSGPTMFALSANREVAQQTGARLQQHFSSLDIHSDILVSKINPEGAEVRS
ncbi:MAG: homoserine kinase [Cyclobacteriaceae bacterium]|nr:homoserine kinase [Cyclobacteriaceae bacterium]